MKKFLWLEVMRGGGSMGASAPRSLDDKYVL